MSDPIITHYQECQRGDCNAPADGVAFVEGIRVLLCGHHLMSERQRAAAQGVDPMTLGMTAIPQATPAPLAPSAYPTPPRCSLKNCNLLATTTHPDGRFSCVGHLYVWDGDLSSAQIAERCKPRNQPEVEVHRVTPRPSELRPPVGVTVMAEAPPVVNAPPGPPGSSPQNVLGPSAITTNRCQRCNSEDLAFLRGGHHEYSLYGTGAPIGYTADRHGTITCKKCQHVERIDPWPGEAPTVASEAPDPKAPARSQVQFKVKETSPSALLGLGNFVVHGLTDEDRAKLKGGIAGIKAIDNLPKDTTVGEMKAAATAVVDKAPSAEMPQSKPTPAMPPMAPLSIDVTSAYRTIIDARGTVLAAADILISRISQLGDDRQRLTTELEAMREERDTYRANEKTVEKDLTADLSEAQKDLSRLGGELARIKADLNRVTGESLALASQLREATRVNEPLRKIRDLAKSLTTQCHVYSVTAENVAVSLSRAAWEELTDRIRKGEGG